MTPMEQALALEKAAERGDTDALTTLFHQHIDPNLASGHHAGGALAVACFYQQEKAARLLIEHGANQSKALLALIQKCDCEGVAFLLDHRASPNALCMVGYMRPLHVAAASVDKRSADIAKLLIDHKADIKMRTKEGKTAFDLAVASNNKGVASVLTPDCDCNPH